METKPNNQAATATAASEKVPGTVDQILDAVSIPVYKSQLAATHGTTAGEIEKVIRATSMPHTREGREDFSEAEFITFLMTSAQYRLDPLLGQIYALKVKGRFFIFLGKNAWNTIAQRDKNYDGRKYTYLHKGADGKIYESTFPTSDPLHGVKCDIFKKDRTYPATGIALVSEYKKKVDYATPYDTVLSTMMEHKAFNKGSQDAFGLGDVYDDLDRDVIDRTNYPAEVYQDEVGPPPRESKTADAAAPARPRKPAPAPEQIERDRVIAKAGALGRGPDWVAEQEAAGESIADIEKSIDAEIAKGDDVNETVSTKDKALDQIRIVMTALWPDKAGADADAKKHFLKVAFSAASWAKVQGLPDADLVKLAEQSSYFNEYFREGVDVHDAAVIEANWKKAGLVAEGD